MRQNFSNMWSIMRFLWPDLDQRGEVAYSNFVAWQVNRMDSHYVWTNRKDRWGEPIKVRQFDRESEPGRLVSEMPCVVIHKRREACCKHHPKGFLSVKAPKEIKHIIDLHPKQLKAIHEMEDHMMTWLDDNPLVADIPLVAKVRIRQMCLGVPTVTWTEGEETAKVTFDIDCESPTLDKLLELAEELDEGEPLVVYTDSQKFAEVTVERLNKAGYVAKEYSGVRKAQLSRFGEDYQVLVGVTSSIGTGTDGLNRVCQTEVWLEPPLSVTMETQTAARLDRIGTPRQVERHYILDSTKYLEGRLNDLIEKRIMSNNSLRKAVA